MNHTIKGFLIVASITSMLVLGATIVPIMQSSFASKKHDFKRAEGDPNTNTNTNTNSADSSSSSTATADNTNNITNSATTSQSQEQDACAVAVSCPEGTTTVGVTPPPVDECPHSPYTDFSGGLCQNGEPTLTCTPLEFAIGTPSGPDASGNCTQNFGEDNAEDHAVCMSAGGTFSQATRTCTYPATGPETCPPPEGSTQTPTVVNGRCTIAPGSA